MAGLGHVVVGLAAGRWYNARASASPKALAATMVAFTTLSMAPDLDVIAFRLGIPYSDPFGHRGASHALLTALVIGLSLAAIHRPRPGLGRSRGAIAAVMVVVLASHGLLDTTTYGGGLGVALLWPFDAGRIWSPVRLIPVSPIGRGVFSARGLTVMATELVLFLPAWAYAFWPRRRNATRA